MASDRLPERWQQKWRAMEGGSTREERRNGGISGWMMELYVGWDEDEEFTAEDIAQAEQLASRLVRLEPSSRISAREALQDPWFKDV